MFYFILCYSLEYLIPGTAAPNGTCHFTYRSESKKRGDFNSPRHPANYPNGLNCTFLFLATANEQVTVIFDQFKIKVDISNISLVQFGYGNNDIYSYSVCHAFVLSGGKKLPYLRDILIILIFMTKIKIHILHFYFVLI